MAHSEHLKGSLEAQTGRASVLLIATLMGGLLVVNSFLAEWLYPDRQYADGFALLGAILLGAPLIYHSLTHMMRGEMHMDELVSMAIVAAIAIEHYQEAGVIAFSMVISFLNIAFGLRAP